MKKTKETIKAAFYTWGEFKEETEIERGNLEGMDELESGILLGFDIRKEDTEKTFYAEGGYIYEGADGTAVKYSYAVKED